MKMNKSIFGLLAIGFILSCVKQDKELAEWTVQKRLDRGTPVSTILETYQIHDILGNDYQGGVIIHLDTVAKKGLVDSESPISTGISFGCSAVYYSTSKEVATGEENTTMILSNCGEEAYAAQFCVSSEISEYSDWFLPSSETLLQLFEVLERKSKISVPAGTPFWSSTVFSGSTQVVKLGSNYGESWDADSLAHLVAVREFSY